jgi:hypothetical protein
VYILGKDNRRADALSRRSDIAGIKEINNSAILKIYKDRLLGLVKTINNIMMSVRLEVLKEL